MEKIRIIPDSIYQGEGISQGLARGLLVYYGDLNLTGEGMGIGSVAIRDHKCTYFSRSWTDSSEGEVFRRTFTLDTRMRWAIRGKPSGILTRLIEYGISIYMKFPFLQGMIMLPVLPLRSLLGINPLFETIPSRGTVTFTYRVSGDQVEVQVMSHMPILPQDTLCLLNELSADCFTAGWDGKTVTSPPPGWERVWRLPVSLVDPVRGIRFSLKKPSVSRPMKVSIYRGREHTGDLCWAGFCIELYSGSRLPRLPEVRYLIDFTLREGS